MRTDLLLGSMEDDAHPLDPRGLIREAYRMKGLTKAGCRSIFLDWALGLDDPAAGALAQDLAHRVIGVPVRVVC